MTQTPAIPIKKRRNGALLGLACGDAFGTTNEFARPRDLPPLTKDTLLDGPQTELVGGGPFNVAKGQVTDDTMMATVLHVHLCLEDGIDPEVLHELYRAWCNVTFDIGGQTSAALASANVDQGYISWDQGGRRAAGNGSLMRCAPIGAWRWQDEERDHERIQLAITDAALTHADPKCVSACAAYATAIAHALREEPVTKVTAAAEAAITMAATRLRVTGRYSDDEVNEAAGALSEDLLMAEQDDALVMGEDHGIALDMYGAQGFVRVAFRLAFWHLYHGTPYRDAIIDITNRGGDSDTNAAIVGGLLGAHQGPEALPGAWEIAVINALDRDHRLWEFHPRLFVEV